MKDWETEQLSSAIAVIGSKAKECGLDFYSMRFELCPADIIYTFGAYGMPTRYGHWSFGKNFHKMKTQYDYNLSRIYELVINSDPCYAFLLEGNSLVQNKLVIAHVFAHCDFFKNNISFGHTNRQMLESMASSAGRIREYEFVLGREKVEKFLDAVMSIQEHINPWFISKENKEPEESKITNPYEDLWSLDYSHLDIETKKEATKNPPQPEKDVLLFIMSHSKQLEDWQRDIISIIREEMIYFWPQMQTKIMNEGWASFWHARIMRDIDLTEAEAIEFAKMHSGVIQTSSTQINPYYLGMKIWEDIEKRWDQPTPEENEKYGRIAGKGREKIFEVRETENDISFIRNYLTKELVEELDLYLFKKVYTKWQVVEKDWEKVREGIIQLLNNCGFPYILVDDGDYNLNGELYLKHNHEGQDLDIHYLEKTLPYVYQLWGRTVHLETIVDNKLMRYSFAGVKMERKNIGNL